MLDQVRVKKATNARRIGLPPSGPAGSGVDLSLVPAEGYQGQIVVLAVRQAIPGLGRMALYVEIELHLVGVGAVADFVVLLVHLEGDPSLQEVLCEDLVDEQEIVILLEGLQGFL